MQKGQTQVLILAGIVLVIALAGGIFYLGRITLPRQDSSGQAVPKPQPQNAIISSPQPSPTVSPALSPTTTPDSTANWKTYTSTKYGYFIRYPMNLSIDSSSSSIQPKPDIILNFPKDPNRDYYFFSINISVMDVPANLSLKQAINQVASKYYSIKGIEFQQIKVAGMDTLASEFPQAYYGYVAFLLKDNKLYAFQLGGNPGNSNPIEEKRVFNQILSTFRFTN